MIYAFNFCGLSHDDCFVADGPEAAEPNDFSETLPIPRATAESHQESGPKTEEYLQLRPKRRVMRAKTLF